MSVNHVYPLQTDEEMTTHEKIVVRVSEQGKLGLPKSVTIYVSSVKILCCESYNCLVILRLNTDPRLIVFPREFYDRQDIVSQTSGQFGTTTPRKGNKCVADALSRFEKMINVLLND